MPEDAGARAMGWRDDDKILRLLEKQGVDINSLRKEVKALRDKIDVLVGLEIPAPAVRFAVAVTAVATQLKGGTTMAVKKAAVDFQLLDDGTARLTATALDKKGLATKLPDGIVASWKSSAPGLVITQDLVADPTGLTATAAPSDPPVLVTGAIPTVSADNVPQEDGTTATITGDGNPIDIVAGPAGTFVVAEG